MAATWLFALAVSFGLRFWGFQHPEEFDVNIELVFSLLLFPSIIFGIWIGFSKIDRV